MLETTLLTLSKSRVVLASSSPRRRELIQLLGLNAEIVPSTYDENLDRKKYKNHGEFVQDLAYYKVQEVYERLKNEDIPPKLIIGADTIVALGEDIFGKPKTDENAFNTLTRLSGKKNTVFTGVCIRTPETIMKFYESTDVYFAELSEYQIKSYVQTGEPHDKAGAYGVMGKGACLVEKIDGDFYTVVGLPLFRLTQKLNQIFG